MSDGIDSIRIESVLRKSERVYQGKRLNIHNQTLQSKNGHRITKEMVSLPNAVIILPVLEKGEIVLIRNHRYPVGTSLWELPAGAMEDGEDVFEAAKRELEEETGYHASKIEKIISFFTNPGISNQVMFAFYANGLSYFGQRLNEDEKIEVEIHTWDQIDTMIDSGQICDAKTLLTLIYYKTRIL